jgi:hypothetical protein
MRLRAPTATTEAATSVTGNAATLHASVNPTGSEVSECRFEYGTSASYGQSAPCAPSPGSGESPVAVSAAIGGLASNTTYHFRIFAKNGGGESTGSDRTFTTLPPPPTVTTEAALPVAQTSATANGKVNPNGFLVSDCHFEYGPTTAYGKSAPCTQSPGSGTTPVAVSAALESLAENTTYHFRISATSVNGTNVGSDQTFTTTLVLGPHWYDNGVRLAEGETLKQLAWGTVRLTNVSTGMVTCKTAAGVETENPPGGGAGKGTVPGVIAYACVAPMCETAGGKAELVPEKLPWTSVLIEQAPPFRDKLEGLALQVICAATEQSVQFHGSLKPEVENGTIIGVAPSTLEFAGSGSLQSTAGAGEVTGKWKLMGYGAQELTQVKNP